MWALGTATLADVSTACEDVSELSTSNQIYLRHIVQHEQANNSEKEKECVNRTQRHDKSALTCDLKKKTGK